MRRKAREGCAFAAGIPLGRLQQTHHARLNQIVELDIARRPAHQKMSDVPDKTAMFKDQRLADRRPGSRNALIHIDLTRGRGYHGGSRPRGLRRRAPWASEASRAAGGECIRRNATAPGGLAAGLRSIGARGLKTAPSHHPCSQS